MRYRSLGTSGITVSEIGFGTWGIGGVNDGARAYGPTDDEVSITALAKARDLGITLFDSSDLYGFGHAEELLGRTLSKYRSEVIYATKCGFLSFSGEQDFSPQHIEKALQASLRRLRTDYVDLYQLHSPEPTRISDATFDALTQLKRMGAIRAIGVSARNPDEGLLIVQRHEIDALQVNFNYTDQRALDNGLFASCEARGIGIIARTPLAFGFLTGSYDPAQEFPEGDHRQRWSLEQKETWVKSTKLFTSEISATTGQTPAQIALRFCLSFAAVSTTIPGMLNKSQVTENAQGGELGPLTEEQLQKFRTLYLSGTFFRA